ncbi:MAG: hypothetical protein ACYDAB_08170 [bacterium]
MTFKENHEAIPTGIADTFDLAVAAYVRGRASEDAVRRVLTERLPVLVQGIVEFVQTDVDFWIEAAHKTLEKYPEPQDAGEREEVQTAKGWQHTYGALRRWFGK